MTQVISKSSQKTRHVADTLRGRIVSGELEPGAQLPTWNALEGYFNVGRTTLTRALGQLKRDGFVITDATRGTFVAPTPPHKHRFALAFHGSPTTSNWNPFWWALSQQAVMVNQTAQAQLVPFYSVGEEEHTASLDRLLAEVAEDRFAGVIFVGYPPAMSKQLIDHPWLAKVAICGDRQGDSLPHVYPDRGAFMERALRYVADQGRKRVAVITNGHRVFHDYQNRLADYGLCANPCGCVAASVSHPDSAGQIVRLMLNQTGHPRPDALIVTDDTLLHSTLTGLMAEGVRLPDELLVVAHCNWPTDSTSALPVVRLGFDAAATLEVALREAEAQRHGQQPTSFTPISPIFDFERSGRSEPFATSSFPLTSMV